jgi:hypothetical protein
MRVRWLIARVGEDPILLAILIAGCAVRIAWVASANVHPIDDTLLLPPARGRRGCGPGLKPQQRPADRVPAAGLLAAARATYWPSSPQYVAGGLNVLISAGIIVLTYMLARRLRSGCGQAAAAAAAFFPPSSCTRMRVFPTSSHDAVLAARARLPAIGLR